MQTNIPKWVQKLPIATKREQQSIAETVLPTIRLELEKQRASRLLFLRRNFENRAIGALTENDVLFRIKETEHAHGSTTQLGFEFLAHKHMDNNHNYYYREIPEDASLDLLSTLSPEQRLVVANTSVRELCKWCEEIGQTFSLRHAIAQEAFRVEDTFSTLLPQMWENLSGTQKVAHAKG